MPKKKISQTKTLYKGHSHTEALALALAKGLIVESGNKRETHFVRALYDRERKVALLTQDPKQGYVLTTVDTRAPTREDTESFKIAYLNWLRQKLIDEGSKLVGGLDSICLN